MFDILEHKENNQDSDEIASLRRRLIVALDVETSAEAADIIESLGDEVEFYKIGLQLLTVGGIELAELLEKKQKNVFLDYKLFDIGITVKRAMQSIISRVTPAFITVHGDPYAIKSAAEVTHGSGTKILAVTIPTNWSPEFLKELGYRYSRVDRLIAKRGLMALEAGADGLICSALEAKTLRKHVGPDPLIVTPGIRLESNDHNDQKRVATPEAAIRAGADYLVVGRPITQAIDPASAVQEILNSMQAGLN